MSDLQELTQAITLMTKEITRLIQSQDKMTQALIDSDNEYDTPSAETNQYLS